MLLGVFTRPFDTAMMTKNTEQTFERTVNIFCEGLGIDRRSSVCVVPLVVHIVVHTALYNLEDYRAPSARDIRQRISLTVLKSLRCPLHQDDAASSDGWGQDSRIYLEGTLAWVERGDAKAAGSQGSRTSMFTS